MESIQLQNSFLETHLPELQFVAIFGGMVLLFLIEGLIPRRKEDKNQTVRWLSNIGLTFFNHFIILIYTGFVFAFFNVFKPESPVLDYFKVSDISAFLIILLLMEFLNYWIHVAFHKIPFLWRIHAVHHSDTMVDVTTSNRHHTFEPLISTIIISPIIIAMGAPLVILAAYNFVHTAFSLISHSNIKIPEKLDNILRLFVITPDFHLIHHSSDQRFTDSNYGGMVPWFDYLFKTATRKPAKELETMELGLESLRSAKDQRLDRLLITPFIYKPRKSTNSVKV